jgi:DEAD/DEAH box helicase domain-containing protein
MVEGRPYHVDRLDWEARKAYVRKVETEYYTQAMTYSKVRILEAFGCRAAAWGSSEWGEVHVVNHVPGYKKIKFYTLENVGYGEIDLPDLEMHTAAAWWTFDPGLAERLELTDAEFLEGLAGISYLLQHLAALRCLCDVGDLGRALGDREGRWSFTLSRSAPGSTRLRGELGGVEMKMQPTLFLHEQYPGGSGLAEGIHSRTAELFAAAHEVATACPCEGGCPSCVGPAAESGAGAKSAALAVLGATLGHR